jgi:hypothetical protein
MAQLSKSSGTLVMWGGLVLLLLGVTQMFFGNVGLGIGSFAVGAAMEGTGYLIKNRAAA